MKRVLTALTYLFGFFILVALVSLYITVFQLYAGAQ